MNAMILFAILAVQTPQESFDTYVLGDRRHLVAKVLEVNGDGVRLKVPINGGSHVVLRRLEQFIPHCQFRILQAVADPSLPGDHLELSEFAATHGLVAVAQKELGIARELSGDENLAEDLEQRIQTAGAEGLESLFHEQLESGKLSKARSSLSQILIRYPETEVAGRKKELLAELDEAETRRVEARLLEKTENEAKRREQLLKPVQQHMERGKVENRQGLLDSKHFSAAHARFMRAVRHFESSVQSGQRILKRQGDDEALHSVVNSLRVEAEELLQRSLLNAANLSVVRAQFNQALGNVNRVLAIDPENQEARAMRARIEIAANQSIYGYGYRRSP